MGRKKNIENLSDVEKDIINDAMNGHFSTPSVNNLIFDYKIQIKCKNQKQKEFLKLMKEKDITFAVGSPGTGKSFISLSYALDAIKNTDNPYKKIIVLIPTCQAGKVDMGLLPGTISDKTYPFKEADMYTMEKILSSSGNLGSKLIVKQLFKDEIIEHRFVNFIRGFTFSDSIILINEAENFNIEEMLLILTRIGENCKVILTGDPQQTDRKDIKSSKKDCGLVYAVNKLKEMDEVGVVEFSDEDIVRSQLITKILNLWKE